MIKFITQKITRKKLRAFLSKHKTKDRVLEIGAKNRPYKDLFPNALVTDIETGKNIDQIVDAHKLPFKNNSFSVILCTEVLEHCYDPDRVLSEFYRVLKPKGKLILTTRFIFPIHDSPNDYFRFTKYGLKLLTNKFSKVSILEESTTLETISVLLQRIAYQAVIVLKYPIFNIILHLIAKTIAKFSSIIRKEYGNINRNKKEKTIMTSGYYVIAIK